jgi:hypothetical protein
MKNKVPSLGGGKIEVKLARLREARLRAKKRPAFPKKKRGV